MMNHVRVKALKGDGKTVSNKAKKSGRASGKLTPSDNSPLASLLTSPSHSKAPSRAASDVSDDEAEEPSFDSYSNSGEEFLRTFGDKSDEADDGEHTGVDSQALIDQLRDHKNNNAETRERHLEIYISYIKTKYSVETHEWLEGAAPALVEIFLNDANRGPTARERFLSLQAFCLTVSTAESLDLYSNTVKMLKSILADDDDDDCRVYALYSLCMVTLYAGGGEEEALDLMEYFVDIVASDGDSIKAYDNAIVVAAVLQSWAFVASHVEDYSDFAEMAMDAFVDQLDSGDVDVRSNAASSIALIFESSRNHEDEHGEPFQLPYDPARLSGRLGELAKVSGKSTSRKERRGLRDALVSVVTSLERGVGPGFSTVLYLPGPEESKNIPPWMRVPDGRAMEGYRLKLRLGSSVALIDSWSLLSRVKMMKALFKSGLQRHVHDNPIVSSVLDDAAFEQNAEGALDGKMSKHRYF